MKSHFSTLLLREWMQHKRGWMVAALAPAALFLAAVPFGKMDGLPGHEAQLLAFMAVALTGLATWGIALLVSLFQLPGLARRDVQDRSIEFWLSLPGGHSESVGATAVAHGLLAPAASLAVGLMLGFPVAMAVGLKMGTNIFTEVSWGAVLASVPALLMRGLVGAVLTAVWLSPVIFTLMAASAWLKRLGVPLVLGGGAVLLSVLHKVYGIHWPLQQLAALNHQIGTSMVSTGEDLEPVLREGGNLWAWATHDAALAISQLGSLQFLGWAAVAGAAFALVVYKRGRIA